MSDFLKYKDYQASVSYSAEDEVLYGKVQGVNDLILFEANSITELKDAFKDAVEDYIETCKEIGKSPEKTYKGSFNVRVSPLLHRDAAVIASQKNVSLNDFVRAAIAYALKHKDAIDSELKQTS